MGPGDVLILESGGGGGWGDPAGRDPTAIAADLDNGFVTKWREIAAAT
jgi:N-methylhydantoinase B